MKGQCHRFQSSTSSFAEMYTREMEIDDGEDMKKVSEAITMAEEYIQEISMSGRWDAFEPSEFFERASSLDAYDQEDIAISLIGFFAWMFFKDHLSATSSLRIIDGIHERFCRSEVLAMLHHTSERMIRQASHRC